MVKIPAALHANFSLTFFLHFSNLNLVLCFESYLSQIFRYFKDLICFLLGTDWAFRKYGNRYLSKLTIVPKKLQASTHISQIKLWILAHLGYVMWIRHHTQTWWRVGIDSEDVTEEQNNHEWNEIFFFFFFWKSGKKGLWSRNLTVRIARSYWYWLAQILKDNLFFFGSGCFFSIWVSHFSKPGIYMSSNVPGLIQLYYIFINK